MAFDWLNKFQHAMEKPDNYAEKTLAAYKLGMKAGGSIAGVRLETQPDCCPAARVLPAAQVYAPDDAPRVPLPGCTLGRRCTCVYRPVMKYEIPAE